MWQPIETAPIEYVLVYFQDGVSYGKPRSGMTVARKLISGCWELAESGSNATDDDLNVTPTHWMELPDPPK